MSAAKVLAALLFLLVAGGVAAGFYQEYYAAQHLRVEPSIGFSGSIGVLGYTVPRPVIVLRITNPTSYDFELENLVLHVYVEGVEVARAEKPLLHVPAGHTVNLELHVTSGALEAALRSAAKALQGGRIKVEVVGKADVPIKLFGAVRLASVTVPFRKESYVEATPPTAGAHGGGGSGVHASVSVSWLVGGRPVSWVRGGTRVTVVVRVSGYSGPLLLEVRQDRRFLPDKTVASGSYRCGGSCTLTLSFTASSGLTVRGYFVRLRGQGLWYEQPPSYPPRLKVGG